MKKVSKLAVFISVAALSFVGGCDRDEISVLRKSAQKGDVKSQRLLGEAYYYGTGVVQDYAEAFVWLSVAAERGDATAQFYMGYAYYSGKGVEKDYDEAVYWLRLAAEQGDATAQRLLASCYYFGEGVSQDYSMAYAWCDMPENQTNKTATKLRSKCMGKMTPTQKEKAARLSRLYTRRFAK